MTTDLPPSPLILSNTDKDRTVQLSASYGEATVFALARFRPGRVDLQRIHSDRHPLGFELSEAEMDALVATWEAYKADRELQAVACLKRQEQVIASAFELAKLYEGIEITTHLKALFVCLEGWKVCLADRQRIVPVEEPGKLLEAVQYMASFLQGHVF
jgi:hypothetical protein